jgi:hypothetical protein
MKKLIIRGILAMLSVGATAAPASAELVIGREHHGYWNGSHNVVIRERAWHHHDRGLH